MSDHGPTSGDPRAVKSACDLGLLRAAGVEGEALDLSGKLGGERHTVIRVVALLSRGLTRLDLTNNSLDDAEQQLMRDSVKDISGFELLM